MTFALKLLRVKGRASHSLTALQFIPPQIPAARRGGTGSYSH